MNTDHFSETTTPLPLRAPEAEELKLSPPPSWGPGPHWTLWTLGVLGAAVLVLAAAVVSLLVARRRLRQHVAVPQEEVEMDQQL